MSERNDAVPTGKQTASLRDRCCEEFGPVTEQITEEIIRAFAAYVRQEPGNVEISIERQTGLPGARWKATALIDATREGLVGEGGHAVEALCILRAEVMLQLRRQKQQIDRAIEENDTPQGEVQ